MRRIYLLAAVFAAAAVHRCVDLLVSAGFARGTDLDYRHVGVAPMALAACAMLAGLLWFAYADRNGRFERLVRSLEGATFRRTFVSIFAYACATLFAIESAEQLLSLGHLSEATSWLGTSVPLALGVFAGISALLSLGIKRFSGAILAAITLIRAVVEVLIALRARNVLACANEYASAIVHASYALCTTRVRGLRAPPLCA